MRKAPIKWTINTAAAEFCVSKDTIRRGLNREGIEPAETYTTKEILRAMGGDFRFESTRRQRAEADRLERENRLADGEIVTVDEAAEVYGNKLAAIVQNLDSLPALVPGISLNQRQVLVEKIEAIKEQARQAS